MPLVSLLRVALRALLANRSRSILTMLGVIIGVASVIAMMAIGEGASRKTARHYAELGLSTLSVWPSLIQKGGVLTDEGISLSEADLRAAATELPEVVAVAPEIRSNCQLVAGSANTAGKTIGTTPDYLYTRGFELAAGRMFTHDENTRGRCVCVLASGLVEILFEPHINPVGQLVRINDVTFTVVGVLKAKADNSHIRVDTWTFVPLETMVRRLVGITPGRSRLLSAIHVRFAVTPEDHDLVDRMTLHEARLESLLRQKRGLDGEAPAPFRIRNMTEHLRASQDNARTFSLLLTAVAGISLMVGGIGIMNIMVVTVAERTREIGIRKAIGARPADIRRQFLVEAMLISIIGGVIGVAAGLGASEALPDFVARFVGVEDFQTAPTVEAVTMSFGFAMLTGLIFGWYPASRAARLDPIVALRYE